MFKRFKSLAELGHLPKHDEHSARAWLYGKLFVADDGLMGLRPDRPKHPGRCAPSIRAVPWGATTPNSVR